MASKSSKKDETKPETSAQGTDSKKNDLIDSTFDESQASNSVTTTPGESDSETKPASADSEVNGTQGEAEATNGTPPSSDDKPSDKSSDKSPESEEESSDKSSDQGPVHNPNLVSSQAHIYAGRELKTAAEVGAANSTASSDIVTSLEQAVKTVEQAINKIKTQA